MKVQSWREKQEERKNANTYKKVKVKRVRKTTIKNVKRPMILFSYTLLVLMLLGAGIFGLLIGYDYIKTSAYFDLKNVNVVGSNYLGYSEVADIAGVRQGESSLSLNMKDIYDRLMANSWIEHVVVRRQLPDTLDIEIVEKVPAFWRKNNETLYYATVEGEYIAPVEPSKMMLLPLITIETSQGETLQVLGKIDKAIHSSNFPPQFRQMSWIRIQPRGQVEVLLAESGINIVFNYNTDGWLFSLSKVLSDLKNRSELNNVKKIICEPQNVWVLMRQNANLGKVE